MAVAKKCDICGALYEIYNIKKSEKDWNSVQLYNKDAVNNYYSHGIRDICPECKAAIDKAVEERRKATK